MAGLFPYRGKLYSISERNEFGEFVVVKFSANRQNVEGAKVIPAKSPRHVEQLIRTYNFENFKELPKE